MAKTKGVKDLLGWQKHSMLRDIAAGVKSPDEIAENYGVTPNAVYEQRRNNKARIQAILDDWSNQFSDLWTVQKHNRIAVLERRVNEVQLRFDELEADAEAATETMRKVHPEANPVRVPLREWKGLVVIEMKLLDQICREMGQDIAYVDRLGEMNVVARLQLLGLRPGARTKAEKRHLAEPGHEDLSVFTFEQPVRPTRDGTAEIAAELQGSQQLTVSEIKAQIEWEASGSWSGKRPRRRRSKSGKRMRCTSGVMRS